MSSKPRKRRGRRKQKGEGPAWDWIKKTAGKVHDFVKDKKLISKGLSGLATLGTPYSSGFARASNVASSLGYGRKKRCHRRKN